MLRVLIACAPIALQGCGGGGSGDDSASNVSAPPTSNVSGVVSDLNGAPIVGATVIAYRTNDHTERTATTDSSGQYSFSGLLGNFPYGNYELRVEKTGFGFLPSASGSVASVIKQDYNALYRMVIAVPSHGGHTVTSANFVGLRPGDHRIELPRTGQTASYGVGDDGDVAKGVAWPGARFVDNANGTVTDALTGLVWLKDAGCFAVRNWTDALTAANTLASGSCGLTDGSTAGQWRMPNIAELESLVDVAHSSPALSSTNPFDNVGTTYWS